MHGTQIWKSIEEYIRIKGKTSLEEILKEYDDYSEEMIKKDLDTLKKLGVIEIKDKQIIFKKSASYCAAHYFTLEKSN